MRDSYVLIPARGGSKGVPKKNIKLLCGKPLIYYTIDAAREIFDDQQIIVSTDDAEIKECVEDYGLEVPFIRPKELATDETSGIDVIFHAINFLEKKGKALKEIVVLQPTSPFRTGLHLRSALSLYTSDLDMIVSAKKTKSNPYFVLFEEDSYGFLRKSKIGEFSRRQDCPSVWEYNGAIYIINTLSLDNSKNLEFDKVKKYEMDEISSIDIDTPLDWLLAESIIKKEMGRN